MFVLMGFQGGGSFRELMVETLPSPKFGILKDELRSVWSCHGTNEWVAISSICWLWIIFPRIEGIMF